MSALSSYDLHELRQSYLAGDNDRSICLIRRLQGRGFALPSHIAETYRFQLNFDFANVRIHTDETAIRFASLLQAKAFTIGQDIFFGAGQFSPYSASGMRLLSHELAHVVQQSHLARGPFASQGELEWEAACLSACGGARDVTLRCEGLAIQREPTFPRRCTRDALVVETERILALARDTNSGDETTQMWSRVATNFDGSTIGTVARRVWTYMFLRHFVDEDYKPGVESIFPRYFFSQKYGWIDGQHFFGFIDYAEAKDLSSSDEETAFAAATKQGVQIEKDQQSVRDKVILGAPRDPGTFGLMQVRPPNTSLFRSPQMVVGGFAGLGASFYGSLTLTGTQGELFSQLDEQRRQKFFLDSAKSAFSYEDIPSNQLGIVFYFRYKDALKGLPPGSIEVAFTSFLAKFLRDNSVENDQAAVDRQAVASGLPFKERYLAPTATEDDIRKRYPDLFKVPAHATAP